jgi:hypothetical protein
MKHKSPLYEENVKKKKSGKGKIIPVLKHHTMQVNGGAEVQLHAFLNSELGGEKSASRPSRRPKTVQPQWSYYINTKIRTRGSILWKLNGFRVPKDHYKRVSVSIP